MAPRTSKHTDELYKDLAALETFLQSQLQPVMPHQQFVSSLRGQLLGDEPAGEPSTRIFRNVFFTAAGLLSSILLVIGGVRVTIKMIETIKDMRQVKQKPVTPIA